MLRLLKLPLWLVVIIAIAVATGRAQNPGTVSSTLLPGLQQPARDQPAQRTATQAVTPKGRIAGRVLTADTAQPVSRARVMINAVELPGGRAASTADDGSYEFTELPAGRYTINVSKIGFIALSYGQRRPLQAGTPLQLGADQELTGVEFRLPRGSVVSGRIADETGNPLPGATVQVLAYRYAQGNRQLVPNGTSQTDDRGVYRVWGLNPGDYYVSVMARNFNIGGPGVGPQFVFDPGAAGPGPGGRGGPGGGPFGGGRGGGGRGGRGAIDQPVPVEAETVNYASTFYPGVPSVDEARSVSVGLSVELLDVNFQILMVRTSRVAGRIANAVTTNGRGRDIVMLTSDVAGNRGRGALGQTYGGPVSGDGSFSIGNVPPGRYILRARGGSNDAPLFAEQPISLAGGDVTDLVVVLAPGGTIAGTVTFTQTQSATVPDATQIRIVAPSVDDVNMGQNGVARVNRDGTFTLDGVPGGAHWIRSQTNMRGWMLKSVTIGGRDVTDIPLDVASGQRLSGVSIVFTDRVAEINGTLADSMGTPITEYTVLAFPVNEDLWRPQSRQIATARPDQNGKYQLRGLPPGDYYLAAVDPTRQGEWFEAAFLDAHRRDAQRLDLGEGDVKTMNFTLTR